MMDNTLAERVPGAGRRKGTYPGRTSDTISFTVIISNIGRGAAMNRVETFYNEALKMMNQVQHSRKGRARRWEAASKTAAGLPDL